MRYFVAAIFFFIFPIVGLAALQEQTDRVPATVTVSSPLSGQRLNVDSPTLGGESLTIVIGRRLQEGGRSIYVPPFFQFDNRDYSAAFEEKCSLANEAEIVTIPVEFRLSSRRVNEEVRDAVNASDTSNTSITSILSYPYAFLTLGYASTSQDEKSLKHLATLPVGVLAPSEDERATAVQDRDFFFEIRPIDITLPCKDHENIVRRNIAGDFVFRAFTNVEVISETSFAIEFVNFARSSSSAKLIQDQKNRGFLRYQSESRGAQIGLNLGSLLGQVGGAAEETQANDTRSRFVTSDLILELASEYSSSMNIQSITRRGGQQGLRNREAIIQKLVDSYLKSADSTLIEFRASEDGTFTIVSNTLERLTLNSADIDALFETSNHPQASQKRSAALDGAQFNEERQFTDQRNIKWERKGGEWIPVQAELYLVGNLETSNAFFTQLEDIVATGESNVQMWALRVIASDSFIPEKIVFPLRKGRFRTVSKWADGNIDSAGNVTHNEWVAARVSWAERAADAERNEVPFREAQPYRNTRSTLCIVDDLPDSLDGFVRIGGKVVRTWDFINGPGDPRSYANTCAPSGHCDGKGERCLTQERNAGCYVNVEWLNWYRDERAKAELPVRDQDVCQTVTE
ncbi:MAG: hypothetical protein AAGB23_13520 [Pseudomonadota bacterium]